ncbi:MAG TPA: ribonuclease J [Erysipelotrichaceae bacterium]|nr:ribonuclease J [Erysipelotrichia bacterium]HPX32719.1 ribonuclease J [Erysipelotrichaceae bacterium]HQA85283.1 ribonuclease J [Erysipelotrichaceae bacterium]
MNNIKIFALGGLDEYGKNMYCIEIGKKLFIVNCGIKRPEDNQFGVEYIVNDFSYVVENIDRLSGIIITHFHDDMMDGLPYLLKEIEADVYAPNLCSIIIKEELKKMRKSHLRVKILPRYGKTIIDGVELTTFGLTHSTPDAIGISFKTDQGHIVVAEQFVVDFDMRDNAYECDIAAIADIGKEGVLCCLIESSYADKEGFTSPRHRISNIIRPVIEDASGRIFFTLYEQNFFRLREIIAVAAEYKKKVFFFDEKMRDLMNLFALNEYYKIPEKMQLTEKQFNNEIDDCIVIVSGDGANVFNVMNKIAIGEESKIELRTTDTIIIASPMVPGTEKQANLMENELYKDNVNIFKLDPKQILSLHPASEDIKMILSLLKPKYVLPVMGDYRNFIAAANLALSTGYTPDKIIILDNGQIATFADGRLISTSEYVEKIGEIMIGTQDNKDITSHVLKDRTTLSTDGVIIVGVAINYKTKDIIGGPDVQSRGVFYVKDSEYLIKNIGKIVVDVITEKVENGTYENLEAKVELRNRIERYVARETGKRPMIIPAIIEINV